MSKKHKFKLGDKVRASQYMVRIENFNKLTGNTEKKWHTVTIDPFEGVVVGMRRLQNGESVYHGDGYNWKQSGSVMVALVGQDLKRKPLAVPVENIIVIEESKS